MSPWPVAHWQTTTTATRTASVSKAAWVKGDGFKASIHLTVKDTSGSRRLCVANGQHIVITKNSANSGDLDVATVTTTSATATWFRNDGQGSFTRHGLASRQSAYDLRLVEMDGDTDLDMLIAGQESRDVVWLENPVRR